MPQTRRKRTTRRVRRSTRMRRGQQSGGSLGSIYRSRFVPGSPEYQERKAKKEAKLRRWLNPLYNTFKLPDEPMHTDYTNLVELINDKLDDESSDNRCAASVALECLYKYVYVMNKITNSEKDREMYSDILNQIYDIGDESLNERIINKEKVYEYNDMLIKKINSNCRNMMQF